MEPPAQPSQDLPANTKPTSPTPEIHTYHCLCTSLLLATSTPLTSIPQRTPTNSLDKAYILPLPQNPTTSSIPHYAVLLSTLPDKKPQVIKSDNGFEKRYLLRCGRCRLVVGYWLDWGQFAGEGKEKVGRREDVVYLLPGGLMGTEEMVGGKDMADFIGFEGIRGMA